MGFIVTRPGGLTQQNFNDYVRELRQCLRGQEIPYAPVPRVPDDGHADRWLYVWDTEEEAEAAARCIRERSRDDAWVVRPTDHAPTRGPLLPLELNVGQRVNGWAFELSPLTWHWLRLRYLGSCRQVGVLIEAEPGESPKLGDAEFLTIVRQVLMILTGMTPEQLDGAGRFQIVDPVAERVLLSLPPFQLSGGNGAVPAASPPAPALSGTPGG